MAGIPSVSKGLSEALHAACCEITSPVDSKFEREAPRETDLDRKLRYAQRYVPMLVAGMHRRVTRARRSHCTRDGVMYCLKVIAGSCVEASSICDRRVGERRVDRLNLESLRDHGPLFERGVMVSLSCPH